MTRILAGLLAALSFSGAATAQEPPADALVAEIPFHPESPPSRVMIDLEPDGNVSLRAPRSSWVC